MQGLPEAPAELAHGHRRRSRRIDRTADERRVQRPLHEPDDVVSVDPGDPLATGPERSAEKPLKRRDHFRQRPPAWSQDEPEAKPDHPHPQRLSALGLGLPGAAQVGEKPAARLISFRELFIATRPVVADG